MPGGNSYPAALSPGTQDTGTGPQPRSHRLARTEAPDHLRGAGAVSLGTTVTIAGRFWTLGRRIDKGGFGEVYAAESNGQWMAIKLVPKEPGAEHELHLA